MSRQDARQFHPTREAEGVNLRAELLVGERRQALPDEFEHEIGLPIRERLEGAQQFRRALVRTEMPDVEQAEMSGSFPHDRRIELVRQPMRDHLDPAQPKKLRIAPVEFRHHHRREATSIQRRDQGAEQSAPLGESIRDARRVKLQHDLFRENQHPRQQ